MHFTKRAPWSWGLEPPSLHLDGRSSPAQRGHGHQDSSFLLPLLLLALVCSLHEAECEGSRPFPLLVSQAACAPPREVWLSTSRLGTHMSGCVEDARGEDRQEATCWQWRATGEKLQTGFFLAVS